MRLLTRLLVRHLLPLAMLALLSGCASTLRTEVTAYHQWPADAAGQSFSFTHTPEEEQDLERQFVVKQVRTQLQQLGLREAAAGQAAQLAVRVDYLNRGRDVRVVERILVDPWYGSAWYGPGYYAPYWGWSGYGYPFHPVWPSMPVARDVERRYTVFQRELKVKISDAADRRALYDVTVKSEGKEGNLPTVMPYLATAAFRDFPGPNGEPRVIELKVKR